MQHHWRQAAPYDLSGRQVDDPFGGEGHRPRIQRPGEDHEGALAECYAASPPERGLSKPPLVEFGEPLAAMLAHQP